METGAGANFEYLKSITDTADRKAILRDLMECYGEDVWNYAYSLLRKTDLANDVTQEVFLKVYRNLTSYRGDSSVKTWILTITRNTAFDLRRSAFFRRITLVDKVIPKDPVPSAESEAMENIKVNEIWEMVYRLPPKDREVLILYAHHQLTMKEIAELLGVREGTVKSRLHHARMKILKMKENESNASS